MNGDTGTEGSEAAGETIAGGNESEGTITTTAAGSDAKTAAGTDAGVKATGDAGATDKKAAAAGEKKPDAKAAAEAKPLEVKFPEGWAADNPLVSEFKKVAGELGIKDSAQAQKLVDLYVKGTSAANEARSAENERIFAGWLDAAKKDAEFGGTKFDATVVNVRKAVSAYGDPELKQLLNDTGLGDHPAVIRLLNKVGLAMAEDNTTGVKDGGAKSDPEKSFHEALYTHPTSRPASRG